MTDETRYVPGIGDVPPAMTRREALDDLARRRRPPDYYYHPPARVPAPEREWFEHFGRVLPIGIVHPLMINRTARWNRDYSHAAARDRAISRTYRKNPMPASIAAYAAHERFAWPGGYALYATTDDGGALCFECCHTERERIAEALPGDGFYVTALDHAGNSDDPLACDHCGATIIDGPDELRTLGQLEEFDAWAADVTQVLRDRETER